MVKVAFVLLVVVGVASCAPEAALRRAKLTREFGRQEIAIANAVDSNLPGVVIASDTPQEELPQPKGAPYPAAGFRPERAFILPTEEADEFNPELKAEEFAPAQEYGPPAQEYGPPTAEDDPLNYAPESERLSLDTGFLRPHFNIRSEKLQAIRAPRPVQHQFSAQPSLYYSPGQGFVYTNQYQSW